MTAKRRLPNDSPELTVAARPAARLRRVIRWSASTGMGVQHEHRVDETQAPPRRRRGRQVTWRACLAALTLTTSALACASELEALPGRTVSLPTDARGGALPGQVERGNFVAVPIPVLNPSLDSGVIVAAGYFHAQTESQAAVQPASVTGIGAMYTSNDSRALMLGHQAYWDADRWRFTGALGHADLNLNLVSPSSTQGVFGIDWRIQGQVLVLELDRRLVGNWYGGLRGRVLEADQEFALSLPPVAARLAVDSRIRSSGVGLSLLRDTRDLPGNPYAGTFFKASVLANDPVFGSDDSYRSADISLRGYRQLAPRLVLASELQGCRKSGEVPLWDACTLGLRGFAATDFLGLSSARARLEARWNAAGRWGLVAFGGIGRINASFSGQRDGDYIESYGAGVRFTVLEAKRTNLRLDYARSGSSSALYISVGEAF